MASGVGTRGGAPINKLSDRLSNGHGRAVKITREWRLYILGATLCAVLTVCSRNFSDRGGPYFMASLALAGIVYLLSVRELFAKLQFDQTVSRRVIVIGLLLAAAW